MWNVGDVATLIQFTGEGINVFSYMENYFNFEHYFFLFSIVRWIDKQLIGICIVD